MAPKENPRLLSRADFLRLGVAGLFWVAIGADYELSVPKKHPLSKENTVYPVYPGWIEGQIESPFLRIDDGHFPFLREAIFKDPALLALTKNFYANLLKHKRVGQRVVLGETLAGTIEGARLLLADKKLAPETNLDIEAAHAGIYAFAAGFFPHFEVRQFQTLGVPVKEGQTARDIIWGEDGLGTRVFPNLFGVEGKEKKDAEIIRSGNTPRYSGQDRTVHFANHLFLTSVFLYARHFNLREQINMPKAVEQFLSLFGGGLAEREARILSEASGWVYEWLALRDLRHLPFPGRDIVQGPFEDMVAADYKGNHLGKEAACAIWRRLLAGQSLNPVFTELNDKRFSKLEEEPRLKVA